jgi:hypothetical protein
MCGLGLGVFCCFELWLMTKYPTLVDSNLWPDWWGMTDHRWSSVTNSYYGWGLLVADAGWWLSLLRWTGHPKVYQGLYIWHFSSLPRALNNTHTPLHLRSSSLGAQTSCKGVPPELHSNRVDGDQIFGKRIYATARCTYSRQVVARLLPAAQLHCEHPQSISFRSATWNRLDRNIDWYE